MSAAKRICTREVVPNSFATSELPMVIEYEFVIKNFPSVQSSLATGGRGVKSHSFPMSGLPKWSIKVYPAGYSEIYRFGVAVAVDEVFSGRTSEIFDTKIRFLNNDRRVIAEHYGVSKDTTMCTAVVYYIHKEDFTTAIPLSDQGDLIVNVQVTLIGGVAGNGNNIPPSTFSQDISTALQSGFLSDFTVVSKDKREFRVHKLILATRVPHFERMFASEMSEVQQKRVEVDFSGDCVEALLQYSYGDGVVNLGGIVVRLVQLACVYHVDRLVSICVAHMVKNLCEENVYESLRIAHRCGIVSLQSACHKFTNDILSAADGISTREIVPLPMAFAMYDFTDTDNRVINFEYVIKNFADTQSQLDRIVKSFPQNDLSCWRIVVYPTGFDSRREFVVCVSLEKMTLGTSSFGVKFKFLNDDHSVIIEEHCGFDVMSLDRSMCYSIPTTSALVIPVSDSGHLIVCVEITLVSRTGYDVNVPPSTLSLAFSNARHVQSHNVTDFTVVSKDKREFCVHKLILATRVPHFERMFASEMSEVQQKRVEVDFSGDCVEALLQYVYEDEVDQLDSIVVELVQLASVYCMDRLVSICVTEMVKNLDQETLRESLHIADRYGIVSLQSGCHKFIRDNPDVAAKVILHGN